MNEAASLMSKGGTRLALKSVHIEGRIEGLLANVTIGQHYCNDGESTLEVVYTFPVAWGAALLGTDIIIGEKRLQAEVFARSEAWERYEEAVYEGDSPILVEQSDSGIYTANIGNIEPGESVTLYIRYAQLLRFEQGQIRLNIPSTVAPRPDTGLDGILPLPASTTADSLVEYPLTIYIKVLGELAKATIDCPTHSCNSKDIKDGKAISLNSAMLDRDFVLLLGDVGNRAITLLAPDDENYLALASFCPDPRIHSQPLELKILVDCSCSMAGDSMTQAKQALRAIHDALKEEDSISFSRFGDHYVNDTYGLKPWSLMTTKLWFAACIETVRADMGGTRLGKGINKIFTAYDRDQPRLPSTCVLLISDGELWAINESVQESQSHGQPVFTLGVGSAPVESQLRGLAEKTGGTCELVSPNENITDAVTRLLDRMRGVPMDAPHIDWSSESLWQSPLPLRLYAGDTLHAFALLKSKPEKAPALYWNNDAEHCYVKDSMKEVDAASADTLVRLGGAKRMAEAGTPEEARELALKYQVVGEHSALFLLHGRGEAKMAVLPQLHQVPQMLAAGYAGYGSVLSPGSDQNHDFLDKCWKEYLTMSPGTDFQHYQLLTVESPSYFRRLLAIKMKEYVDPKQLQLEWTRVSTASESGDDRGVIQSADTAPHIREHERLLLALADTFGRVCTGTENAMILMSNVVDATRNSELKDVFKRISEQEKLPLELIYALSLDWLQTHCKSCGFSEPARRSLRVLIEAMPEKDTAGAVTAIAEAFKDLNPDLLPKDR